MISFFIPEVRGKGRPRFFQGHAVTPPETRRYESLIKSLARATMYAAGKAASELPCKVYIKAFFDVPKSYSKKKREQCLSGLIRPGKPDIDNIAKAVLDGMNGIVYSDDKCVYEVHSTKEYSQARNGVEVSIEWPYEV